MLVASKVSCPAITSSSIAASSTVRANGPTWSRLDANASTPYRDTRPYVGFTPTTPHKLAGWRIEPPVSVPIPRGANPAATAAALPPLEPPGTRARSHGLWLGPYAEFSVEEPIANSSRLALPTIGMPAALSFFTTVASYGGAELSRIFEPAVVRTPATDRMSLSASGTPASGP